MKHVISNNNFFGYGIGVLLYVNTLFEFNLEYFGFKVSELCIILIMLSVLVVIFNEINKILIENYPAKNIKYYQKTNYYKNYSDKGDFVFEENYFKLIPQIHYESKENFKVFISLLK